MYNFNSRAWLEVDLDNIKHNIVELKKIVHPNVDICAVVKADAYGHGAMEITKTLIDNGVTYLAVSILDEALQIRKMGINTPILVLNYTHPSRLDEVVLNNITQTVFTYDLAKNLSDTAVRLNKDVKIHIKVDTGMNRIGFMSGYSAVKSIIDIYKLKRVFIEGLFTHFSSADESDHTYTEFQFEKFISICCELKRIGIHIPVQHVCNSAGIINFPHMHLDMIRPGIILYGYYPSNCENDQKILLKPAMTLKANVISVKEVPSKVFVGYGRTFKTEKESIIATIPVGYADGYNRLLSNNGSVCINGEIAKIVGTVCMDQCMIDVTNIKNKVMVGDEIVFFGDKLKYKISIEDVATRIGTINYEVMCVIGKRIPRVYIKDGVVYDVLNYIN